LRICAESELGLSLKWSGAWAVHRPGLVIVADAVVDEPVLLASVLCHECGHAALLEPESVSESELDLAGLQSVLSSPWRSWGLHQGELWAGHDWKWIRAVLHVVHRAKAWGLLTVPEAVADLSGQYGLSSLGDYSAALGHEPAALDWLPLAEALARPAPAEFEELWAADVRRSVVMGSKSERKSDEFERSGTSAKSGAGRRRRRT
jgi:hypothetical protein